jgi:ParB-like chromosome segregation protein Spo0J
MPTAEMESLERALRTFGFVDPVIANRREAAQGWKASDPRPMIVGGHQRCRAAEKIGLRSVPVVFVSLGAVEEKALNLALNRIGGEFDPEKLALVIQEIQDQADALAATGFSEAEIAAAIASLAKDAEAQAAAQKVATLAERFGVPPFSILDARQGYWRARKEAWLSLGIKSEIGRGENLLKFSETVLSNGKRRRPETIGPRAGTKGPDAATTPPRIATPRPRAATRGGAR